ncbi:MAG: methylenetetrahydrofolate reductase [Terricaulis sp.]|nr:methylenetetrahydrofolate reductase [Terricaulis sp.]
MKTRLQQAIERGEFVATAEVTPPLSTRASDLLDKAGPLKGLAHAVNVTDGASARAHMDALAAAIILQRAGIEPILQLTCRDRNRIALQKRLGGRSSA